MEALVVELGGPTMFARIGVMRALNVIPIAETRIGANGSWRAIDNCQPIVSVSLRISASVDISLLERGPTT
jgi:hypothetical protein